MSAFSRGLIVLACIVGLAGLFVMYLIEFWGLRF